MVTHLHAQTKGLRGLVATSVEVDEEIVHVAVDLDIARKRVFEDILRLEDTATLETAANENNDGVLVRLDVVS